jgi:hypothetical protein
MKKKERKKLVKKISQAMRHDHGGSWIDIYNREYGTKGLAKAALKEILKDWDLVRKPSGTHREANGMSSASHSGPIGFL